MPTAPAPTGLVTHEIKIAGKALPFDFQVASIMVYKEVNRIPAAVISFIDGDPALQKFEVNDKDDILPGKEVEISVGYDTTRTTIFKGLIVKLGVRLHMGSSYTVVECRDKAVKMTTARKSNFWEKKKDSEVFSELTGLYGLSATAEATNFQHAQLTQYDCTDWDFMVMRAEINGKLVIVDDGDISIKKPATSTAPVLTLTYGQNILEFESEIDARHLFTKVSASAWDPQTQKVIKSENSSSDVTDIGNITSATLADALSQTEFKLFHPGAVTQDELKEWSAAKFMKNKLSKVRGRVKCPGFSAIKPGLVLEIKGISNRFNDKVFVSAVQHDIRQGNWTTHIQFGITDAWFTEQLSVSGLSTGGLLPSVHGLQVGQVTKIDSDPDSQNRIQVSLPLFGEGKNIWARMAFADAGNKRGVYFIPEVEDEVLIGFLNNDSRYPVVLGTLYNSKKAPPITTDAKNNEKGIISREDIRIIMNDEDKSITISTPKGNKVILSDKDESVTLTDIAGNKVILDKSAITLNGSKDVKIVAAGKVDISATQDVTIKGMNVTVTANTKFSAQGQAGSELKSSAMVTVQGAMVKIN